MTPQQIAALQASQATARANRLRTAWKQGRVRESIARDAAEARQHVKDHEDGDSGQPDDRTASQPE